MLLTHPFMCYTLPFYSCQTSTFAWGDEIACMCGDDMTVYEQVGQKLCPWECSEAGGVESWCTTDRFYTWIFLVEGMLKYIAIFFIEMFYYPNTGRALPLT